MNLCNLLAPLFLLILLDRTDVTSSVHSPCSSISSGEGSSDDCDTTFTVSVAGGKPPISGSPTRFVSPYGFLENSCQNSVPLVNDSKPSENNYWRITCPEFSQKMMIVVMSLHLSSTDYVQVKHMKFTGTIEKRFHTFYFKKRSILVALVGGNHVYSYQSSFLLGYVCVDRNSKQLAEELLLQNPKIQEYIRCRPHTFKIVAKIITQPSKILSYNSDTDWMNILSLKNNTNSVLTNMPPCTEDQTESSSTSGSST